MMTRRPELLYLSIATLRSENNSTLDASSATSIISYADTRLANNLMLRAIETLRTQKEAKLCFLKQSVTHADVRKWTEI